MNLLWAWIPSFFAFQLVISTQNVPVAMIEGQSLTEIQLIAAGAGFVVWLLCWCLTHVLLKGRHRPSPAR